ncbi:Sec-independent protein translocase protein TatB [Candidatus Pandoraea novymonadis]|uniref:Sec-independent protein translocase protein TatB n=1 Tax=Candidatus Pandoraea novymonadis TaxID=1808959 RepID=A0ABX5FDN9_9BURK|nr:Sec-independent protein translocase protein TatB [Candidatus Pandoraea novymonadis]PSB91588.1 Sec-independent protein translocase protein TatB [Candidatus Pandoraea novymonadis]
MIDLGLSKLILTGVVALVVIGPERLPKVTRMAGALFSRAQRYLNDVKAQVKSEMELDELLNVGREFEDIARGFESTINTHLYLKDDDALNDIFLNEATMMPSTHVSLAHYVADSVDTAEPTMRFSMNLKSVNRRNWRVKRRVMPLWYKQATRTKIYLQSGAARMARHMPRTMRRPMKFF